MHIVTSPVLLVAFSGQAAREPYIIGFFNIAFFNVAENEAVLILVLVFWLFLVQALLILETEVVDVALIEGALVVLVVLIPIDTPGPPTERPLLLLPNGHLFQLLVPVGLDVAGINVIYHW